MDVRIAVLASGAGSNLQALLDDTEVGRWIALVVSDRADAAALERARARGLRAVILEPARYATREEHDLALEHLLEEEAIEFVVLAGYMRVLGTNAVRAYEGRILNVHPSLLPAFPGTHAVRDARDSGVKMTGATVHLVDEEIDHGPIVLQESVPVLPGDTEAILHARIQEVEHRLFPRAVRLMVEGRLKVDGVVRPVRRALVSVADKGDLVELGAALAGAGVAIVSSGSTAAVLRDAGVPVTPVSEVTGFPEMLGGRVKTLHPRVHAGILADTRKPEHLRELEHQGIEPFDLVVVNLYPFERTIAGGATVDEAIEQIDIGGPTLVRAAAKNFESVAVIVNPLDYAVVLDEIGRTGGLSRTTRFRLASAAFERIEAYDRAIATWFRSRSAQAATDDGANEDALPERLSPVFRRVAALRYGENPHLRGALYAAETGPGPLGGAEVLQGKEMSFNNWLDAESARGLAGLFRERPACVIVKHNNPCGVALADSRADAYRRALAGDTVSAFGGIVAFNGEADEEAAAAMADVFTEVVIAPSYTDGALRAFGERQNLRVVRAPIPAGDALAIRPIDGGALVEDADTVPETREDMKAVTTREPTEDQWRDLLFAWRVAAMTKSNAIVLARDEATLGVGAGQMNRLYSVDIASRHAGERARGAVLASDAFFPFRDGIDRAAEAGVAAIVQPGGSVRDEEIVAACEERGIAMVFTGRRHFRH